jgi:signal transduction histidine kinase
VLIQVADNGIGIEPEYHEKIFQVFQRLHSRDEYPGTGLGLAIVVKAARALEGDVSVESAAGRGSTFSVRLPAAPSPAADQNL